MVIGEEGGGGIGKRGSLCYCNIAYTLSNPPYSPNLLWRTSPELQMSPHGKKVSGSSQLHNTQKCSYKQLRSNALLDAQLLKSQVQLCLQNSYL